MLKLDTLKARHARERRALLRQALEASAWTYQRAAELLGCSASGLQKMVERDEVLFEERGRLAERAGVGGRPAA